MKKSSRAFHRLVLLTILVLLLAFVVSCGAQETPAAPTAAAPAPNPAPTRVPAQPTSPPRVAQPTTAPAAPPTETSIPVEGAQVLRIGRGAYPASLDPQKASYVNEIEVLRLAYEGLSAVDNQGNLIPAAAESWDVSPDGTQITFHLRPNLERADGRPITAEDFVFALRRAIDPRVPGKQYTTVLYDIKGARALDALATQNPNALDPALVEQLMADYGVIAQDPQTLVVTLDKPASYWPYIASMPVTFPVDPRAVAADPDGWWKHAENHVGNGPFIIQTLDESRQITYAPNPNYWRGKPKLDRIETSYNPDQSATLQAYLDGALDINANLAPEQLTEVTNNPAVAADLIRYPAASTRAIAFNNSLRPFDDKNVRIAFSQAFDRKGYVREVLNGVGQPYTRWIPPGVPGAQPDVPGVPDTDQAAAVKTLVENGYGAADSTPENPKVDCVKLGELKITYPDSPQNHPRYQFIARNFESVFGCPVILEPVDAIAFAELTKDVRTNPQISRQGWAQDFPHPQNWLSTYWVCGAFSKNYGYCNLQLDELLARADAAPTLEEAITLYQEAENLLLADVPAAFANYDEYIYLAKPYVIGAREHTGPGDAAWPGQYGPVWEYWVDLSRVPADYPKE